jgi:hypothetical protein
MGQGALQPETIALWPKDRHAPLGNEMAVKLPKGLAGKLARTMDRQ